MQSANHPNHNRRQRTQNSSPRRGETLVKKGEVEGAGVLVRNGEVAVRVGERASERYR